MKLLCTFTRSIAVIGAAHLAFACKTRAFNSEGKSQTSPPAGTGATAASAASALLAAISTEDPKGFGPTMEPPSDYDADSKEKRSTSVTPDLLRDIGAYDEEIVRPRSKGALPRPLAKASLLAILRKNREMFTETGAGGTKRVAPGIPGVTLPAGLPAFDGNPSLDLTREDLTNETSARFSWRCAKYPARHWSDSLSITTARSQPSIVHAIA